MNCSSIDWSATGSWMQAWAGFAQALAVVFAASIASKTFKSWRQQKVEERRIENAEQIGALLYRMRRAFALIRRSGFTPQELEGASTKLADSGLALGGYTKTKQDKILKSQMVLDRIDAFVDVWNDLARLQPIAQALFGSAVGTNLANLSRQKMKLETAASHYPSATDKALTAEIELALTAPTGGVEDEFASQTDALLRSVEDELLPIIRHTE